MITDEQVEAAWKAWRAHFERFVIYSHGTSNIPSHVVDEGTAGWPTVYGPAVDCEDWNGRNAARAALEAAAALSATDRETGKD